MRPTRLSVGTISRSISSHLPPIEGWKFANPVTFPVGLAKFVTNPLPSGSETDTNTNGIVRTYDWRIAVTTLEFDTIKSGDLLNNSIASARVRAGSSAAYRKSI
jgi:hypothetical protein